MQNFYTEKEKSNLIDIDKRELAVRSIFLKAAILNSSPPNVDLELDSGVIPISLSTSFSSFSSSLSKCLPMAATSASDLETTACLQNISKILNSVTLDDSKLPPPNSLTSAANIL